MWWGYQTRVGEMLLTGPWLIKCKSTLLVSESSVTAVQDLTIEDASHHLPVR